MSKDQHGQDEQGCDDEPAIDKENTSTNREHARDQHNHNLQKKLIFGIRADRFIELFFAFIITAFTGLLWWTSSDQLGAVRIQTDKMQGQLDAMIETNRITRESLVSVQRAFVFPKFAQISGFIAVDEKRTKIQFVEVRIPWENSGSTPTRGAFNHVSNQDFLDTMPANFDFPDRGNPDHIPIFIGPKGELPSSPMGLDVSVLKAVQERRKHLYLWGWVTYRDIFKDTMSHITRFCHEVIDVRGDPMNVQGGLVIVFSLCPRHNCTDEECKEQAGSQPAK